jgi:hypothetical protein
VNPAKPALNPKTKITVSLQPITPGLRAKSIIATNDNSGNPLPFIFDGANLILDTQTFGHLTQEIMDKLTLLGAPGAIDVLSAWVINKSKQQLAKQAQAAQAKPATAAAPKLPSTVNRPNGAAAPAAKPLQAPKVTPIKPAPTVVPATTPAKVPAATPAKTVTGPAPPGASLTKVIGMIAEVANAKGDVNVVGPNASALLRYIRVVGVDIDLRVAERIWATGVVPPLPPKKPPSSTAKSGLAKPNGAAAAIPRPATATTPAFAASEATKPVEAGVKRKLEEVSAAPVAASVESDPKKPKL